MLKKNLPYVIISFSVAALMILLALIDAYETVELKFLDMRFNSRGRIETRDDIATLDIDVRALQTEGKWDPWSREKHIPVVEAAGQHMMGNSLLKHSLIVVLEFSFFRQKQILMG